jgi:hypothetical protein
MNNEIDIKVLKLILMLSENFDDVMDSLANRTASSTYNVERHERMRDCMLKGNFDDIKACILDPYYFAPLEGVIVCSEVYADCKWAMMNLNRSIHGAQ